MSKEEFEDAVQFYLKNHNMFLADFFSADNTDFNISISSRNVQSGVWYEATWKTGKGEKRYESAMWHKLIWERVIKQHLRDTSEDLDLENLDGVPLEELRRIRKALGHDVEREEREFLAMLKSRGLLKRPDGAGGGE